MVEIVRLEVDAERPSMADDQPWLHVEQSEEGLFYGTGGSWKASGEWVGYRSLSEGDIQMIDSTSVRAHQQAATAKRGIEIIVSVVPEAGSRPKFMQSSTGKASRSG